MKHNLEKFSGKFAQWVKCRRGLKIVSALLVGVALITGTLCVTGFGTKYYRIGGGWVGGNNLYTWSVLFGPSDPLGQTASARPILKYFGSDFAGLLAFYGAENLSDATGEIKMVSPDTGRWTLISYMQVPPHGLGQPLENKAIIISHGTWKFTSDNTAVLNYVLDIYLPESDADHDGFPDAGASPVQSVPAVDTAKRVPIL